MPLSRRVACLVSSVVVVASFATMPARAQSVPRPPQLGLCASCHGEDGRARMPLTPHLAAQDEAYLAVALAAYRDGGRDHAAMRAIAGPLRDADIAALAKWYAAQPAHAP